MNKIKITVNGTEQDWDNIDPVNAALYRRLQDEKEYLEKRLAQLFGEAHDLIDATRDKYRIKK